MKHQKILETMTQLKMIPVVAIEQISDALPLAQALKEGGLPIMEITFRTDCATEAMSLISKEIPDILIGAGTVLTISQVKDAITAGAKFIVTPGYDQQIVDYCIQHDILIIPGAVTPTELTTAIKAGLDIVKFFPAENYGGIQTIRSLSAPFTKLRFIPTGGINETNINTYLAFDKVIACGGTWMCPKNLISEGNFQEITEITRRSLQNIES